MSQSGSLCELVVLRSDEVFPRPLGLDDAGAATLPFSGLLALDCLIRRCGLGPPDGEEDEGGDGGGFGAEEEGDPKAARSVLVVDGTSAAGGPALQVLRAWRRYEATACAPYRAAPLARLLGAARVVPAAPDHADTRVSCAAELADEVFDTAVVASPDLGLPAAFCRRFVRPGGPVAAAYPAPDDGEGFDGERRSFFARLLGGRPARVGYDLRHSDMETLASLVESGRLQPVLDQAFPLSRVAEAAAHVAAGGGVGKTVILMD